MEELQEKKEKILEYKKVFALSENEIEQIIDLWDEDAFVLEPKSADRECFLEKKNFKNELRIPNSFFRCPRCLNQLNDFECNECGWGKNGDIASSEAFLLGYADCGC